MLRALFHITDGERVTRIPALLPHQNGNLRRPHGIDWVVPHMRFVEGHSVYVQPSFLYRPPVYGKGGAQEGEGFVPHFQSGIQYRTDVPAFGGVEG